MQDYHQATLYASRSLKLNSKNKKALSLFERSYRLAVEEHRSNIMDLETMEDDSKKKSNRQNIKKKFWWFSRSK